MLRAVVIGGGRIGASGETPGCPRTLTHAHAYASHPGTCLAGICDADPDTRRRAAATWNTEAFASLDEALAAGPDIVSIASPTPTHVEILRACVTARPRAIVCEKPLAVDAASGQECVAACAGAGIPLAVNFPRRFTDGFLRLREELARGEHGRVLHAVFRYAKGIVHNGVHAVDLAAFLFGPCLEARFLDATSDHDPEDPSVYALLVHRDCPRVFLLPGDERRYSLFELDVLCENGRISFLDSGHAWVRHVPSTDPRNPGFRTLSMAGSGRTDLGVAAWNLVDNLVSHLDRGEALRATGADAVAGQRVCEELLRQWRCGRR